MMKILIEVMHGMGDVVCALPMIKEVRTRYPDSELTVLVNRKATVDIIKCADVKVEHCFCIDIHADIIKALRQCLYLRNKKFDLAIACVNTSVKKSKFMMGIIGAGRTIGTQYKYGKSFNDLEDKYHFVDAHLMALDELGIHKHGFMPGLTAQENDLESISKVIKKKKKDILAGICIGRADVSYRNKKKRKDPVYTRGWGDIELHKKNMEITIRRCLKEGWKVVLLGGQAEKEIKKLFSPDIIENDMVFDFVGNATVAEAIAIVSLCDLVLGVDTGMQHIADAAGTPTVSIFGPTNPKTHGAYSDKAMFAEIQEPCRYCYGSSKYEQCSDRKCLAKISPHQVFALLKKSVEKYTK